MKTHSLIHLVVFTFMVSHLHLATASPGPLDPTAYPNPIRVACVGDSITQGSGADPGMAYPNQLQTDLGDKWVVQNFGVGGRTLLKNGDFPYWKEKALQDAQDFKPDAVVIMLGTNDTKPQNWAHHSEYAGDYQALVEIFQHLPSKPHVFVCLPCPIPEPGNYGINETNLRFYMSAIKKIAADQDLDIIDIHGALLSKPELFPDRVHPNNAGAGIMAKTVAAALTGKTE